MTEDEVNALGYSGEWAPLQQNERKIEERSYG